MFKSFEISISDHFKLCVSSDAHQTSNAVSQQVLPGPETALRSATAAGGKRRQEADAIVQHAVADTSHLLNLLKLCLPLLSGEAGFWNAQGSRLSWLHSCPKQSFLRHQV